MVLECGEVRKEIATKENGSSVNLRGMEFIRGLMATTMKASSKNV